MRFLARLLLVGAILAGFAGMADAQIFEVGKDRAGGDYTSFGGTPGPVQCQGLCAGDGACRAWTWVNPGVQGPDSVCYLKNSVPAWSNNACCTSGVKLAGPVPPGAATAKDRPGADYNSFNLPAPNPKACSDACVGDPSCKAWTYVNPGIQGPQARCYLKNPVPALVNNSCCISGVNNPPPLPPTAEVGKDRPGSDFSGVDLPAADPNLCYNSCQSNGSCLAWTYVKPGVQGPNARCYLKNPAPAAVNNPCCISGLKPVPLPPGAQVGKDRPGSDFSGFDLASADPNLCYNSCQSNGSCLAWTYVKPGVQGPNARCYLKNPVPAAVNNPCCVSGVKAVPPPPLPPGAQVGKDRPGSDFSGVDLPAADPNLCYNSCQSNGSCLAWTYVKPGVQGPNARCYLKNPAPAAVNNPCCISGLKALPPPPLPPGAKLNRDRPGSDFASFDLPAADPSLCYNSCQGNGACLAWTYVKPGVQGPSARCYLKNPVPMQVNNPCCISGVKAAPPPPPPSGGGPFEVNINRPGGDYIDFASGGAHTALLCLAACQSQPACKAWTYVKPGIQGPQSHCWLKAIVPPAQINNCCVSGVK